MYPFLFNLVMSGSGFFMRRLGTIGSDQSFAEGATLKRTFAAQVHTLVVLSQKEISDLQAEWDIPTLHELWVQMESLEKIASAVHTASPLPFHVSLPVGEDWPVRNLTHGEKGIGKQLENEFKRAWALSTVSDLDQKKFRFYKAADNLSDLLAAIGESLHWDAVGVYSIYVQRALGIDFGREES